MGAKVAGCRIFAGASQASAANAEMGSLSLPGSVFSSLVAPSQELPGGGCIQEGAASVDGAGVPAAGADDEEREQPQDGAADADEDDVAHQLAAGLVGHHRRF